MLDSTVESVNSALKRARAGLQDRLVPSGDREAPPTIGSETQERLVAEFVRAYQAGDIDALVDLLTDDVRVSPPIPFEYLGRDAAKRFFASLNRQGRTYDLVPTRANRQPALGPYLRTAVDGVRHGVGLIVLTLTGDRISAAVRFEKSVLPWFGLPRSLPGR